VTFYQFFKLTFSSLASGSADQVREYVCGRWPVTPQLAHSGKVPFDPSGWAEWSFSLIT
jgi:hypothetical protein